MKKIRIAIVHGYFLDDSGSAVYVRELARELTRQGHDVTLVCQETQARDYDFIDACYDLDDDNGKLATVFQRQAPGPGRCRLVRPDLGGTLLTYVAGPFTGFTAIPFQEATVAQVDEYIQRNRRALKTIFTRWRPDFVQANHLVMQPFLVSQTLGQDTRYCVTIHGSALNFTVKADRRMVPYALQGLAGATFIATLSETSRADVIDFAAGNGLDIDGKTFKVPPGVDAGLMRPLADPRRKEALGHISAAIDPATVELGVFAGRLLWTKGVHYAVAAMPLILQSHPDFHLVVVGAGPMEEPLRRLIDLLDDGLLNSARELAARSPELEPGHGYGPVIPELAADEETTFTAAALGRIKSRIHFTGHLDHQRLAPVFGAADISLAPSVFPEAFALVSIEALAAGALPVVTYQSGLREAADVVAAELGDQSFQQLAARDDLTRGLCRAVINTLERYPTRDQRFRGRLHAVAEKYYSWVVVAARYLDLVSGSNRERG